MSIKLAATALVCLLTLTACQSNVVNAEQTEKSQIHQKVTHYANKHGVPVRFAHAVVNVESKYRCNVSNMGSHGIMQVKNATAKSVGVHGSLYNCDNGLEAGMRYLKQAMNKAGGANCVAASFYNRGLYASASCTGYGRKVMSLSYVKKDNGSDSIN